MQRKTLLALLLLCFCHLAIAETVFIEATQDNTLYDSPTGRLSNGMGEHMFVGLTLDQLRRRSVIAFKDLSAIPEGVTVTSVKLPPARIPGRLGCDFDRPRPAHFRLG